MSFTNSQKASSKNSKGVRSCRVLSGKDLRQPLKLAPFTRMAPSNRRHIIFTESRRTQEYLLRLLEASEFAGKIVLFNGTNSDPKSNGI